MPPLPPFRGFPEGKVRLIPIPSSFFKDLLPQIDDLDELKLTLYIFWRLDHMEGSFRYLQHSDFTSDPHLMDAFDLNAEEAQAKIEEALQKSVARGTLLKANLSLDNGTEDYYFLNSPKGRAGAQALAQGEWRPSGDSQHPIELYLEAPNIFRLYEENIGPLTPMIAEALRDAEESFPDFWIEEALHIAVENNIRNWRYVAAILDRWQQEGRYERKDRQNTEKARRKYIEGEYSDFIEH